MNEKAERTVWVGQVSSIRIRRMCILALAIVLNVAGVLLIVIIALLGMLGLRVSRRRAEKKRRKAADAMPDAVEAVYEEPKERQWRCKSL